MKPGRRPKPYVLKAAEGFRGHRKHLPGVEVAVTAFVPPFALSGLALREWNCVLSVAHWLRETEAVAICDRCLCFQRLQECEAQLRKEGLVIQGSRGEVTHPMLGIAKEYRAAMQRYDAELGLTPSSRAGLQLQQTRSDSMDPIEQALCGGLPD